MYVRYTPRPDPNITLLISKLFFSVQYELVKCSDNISKWFWFWFSDRQMSEFLVKVFITALILDTNPISKPRRPRWPSGQKCTITDHNASHLLGSNPALADPSARKFMAALAKDWLFSPGTPVSSHPRIDCLDIRKRILTGA